jgi:uncharacterized protein Yka (UPF0111/DUF47 family)
LVKKLDKKKEEIEFLLENLKKIEDSIDIIEKRLVKKNLARKT